MYTHHLESPSCRLFKKKNFIQTGERKTTFNLQTSQLKFELHRILTTIAQTECQSRTRFKVVIVNPGTLLNAPNKPRF